MLFACSIIIRIYIVGSFSYSYVHATDLITPTKICPFLEKKNNLIEKHSQPSPLNYLSAFCLHTNSGQPCRVFVLPGAVLYCTTGTYIQNRPETQHYLYKSCGILFSQFTFFLCSVQKLLHGQRGVRQLGRTDKDTPQLYIAFI